MSREEFMKQLENLLSDVSEEEKKEALDYYYSYFEDAGEENEERILRELESPEKVAQTIKADLGMGKGEESEAGTYTEQGYQDERFTEKQEMGVRNESSAKQENNDRAGKIVLIVIIAILTSPIWVGAVGGLFGGALGLAGGLLGIAIAAIAIAGSLYIAGAAVTGVAISQLVVGNVAAGTALGGAGFLIFALAILATIGCVWLYGRFLPWLIKGIISLFRRAFSGRGKAE
ncbi:DUF1700 domain-containing protein [Roseburia sp. 499]|uniref:DUF1700 domain-containing protein n=1 Tax=Roseburia sp. 499 TaxID=1261634 RepID=UPI000950E8D4|nr:DUF1700 domain-containing protein [Roseburia sp. 499]WVK70522.1 DUF1700 domain-containing protein [Roseburia sp. 499]